MGRGLFEGWHVVVLIVVVVLLFGWKRMPDAARSLGRSMRIFKSEVGEMKNDGKPHPAQRRQHRHGARPDGAAAAVRCPTTATPPAPPVSDPTLTPPAPHSAAPTAPPQQQPPA